MDCLNVLRHPQIIYNPLSNNINDLLAGSAVCVSDLNRNIIGIPYLNWNSWSYIDIYIFVCLLLYGLCENVPLRIIDVE